LKKLEQLSRLSNVLHVKYLEKILVILYIENSSRFGRDAIKPTVVDIYKIEWQFQSFVYNNSAPNSMNKTINEQYLFTTIINRLSDFLHILAYSQ